MLMTGNIKGTWRARVMRVAPPAMTNRRVPPHLTPEQEDGLIDALDELERGEGVPAEQLYAELREVIERRR